MSPRATAGNRARQRTINGRIECGDATQDYDIRA